MMQAVLTGIENSEKKNVRLILIKAVSLKSVQITKPFNKHHPLVRLYLKAIFPFPVDVQGI